MADRSTSFTISNEQVDTTNKAGGTVDQWRRLSAYGVRTGDIACAGVLTNARILGILIAASIAGATVQVQIIHDSTADIVIQPIDCLITSLERTGEYNGAEMYNLSLSNADGLAVLPPPPWDPSQLPDMVLWLKADQITGTINPQSGMPYVDGEAVSTWYDQSGHHNDAATVSGPGGGPGGGPTWHTNRLNGLPVLSSAMSYVIDVPQNLPMTVYFIMLQSTGGGGNFAEVLDRAYSNGGPALGAAYINLASVVYWDGAGGTILPQFTPPGNTDYKMCSWYFTGASVIVSENQVAVSTATSKANVDTWIGIGNPSVESQSPVGFVGEIIICNADLTGANQALVEAYLKAKWGL